MEASMRRGEGWGHRVRDGSKYEKRGHRVK
jgi:hypothetical protein